MRMFPYTDRFPTRAFGECGLVPALSLIQLAAPLIGTECLSSAPLRINVICAVAHVAAFCSVVQALTSARLFLRQHGRHAYL